MKIIKLSDKEIAETPHAVNVKKLINYEHATIVHIVLAPGEAMKPHITPVDVCFFVLEGKGFILIGDEEVEVEKDQLIFSPKDIVHNLSNRSDEIFRFLVIKTPSPTKATKFPNK